MRVLDALPIAVLLAATLPAAADGLTVALNADIRSTEPGVTATTNRRRRAEHRRGAVGYKENGSVGPLLAETVERSSDELTYTFRLRHGITFHNGAAMTSADMLWSWRHYMDPKTSWRCRADLDGRSGLKVEAWRRRTRSP